MNQWEKLPLRILETGLKTMNETIQEIMDVIREHEDDGYEVPAVRVPKSDLREIVSSDEFVFVEDSSDIEEFEYMIHGTKIIVDENISGVVAVDVKMR